MEKGIRLERWERSLLRRPFNWGTSLTQLTEALLPYDGRLNACLNRTFRAKICLCDRSPNNVQSAVSENKVESNKVHRYPRSFAMTRGKKKATPRKVSRNPEFQTRNKM